MAEKNTTTEYKDCYGKIRKIIQCNVDVLNKTIEVTEEDEEMKTRKRSLSLDFAKVIQLLDFSNLKKITK